MEKSWMLVFLFLGLTIILTASAYVYHSSTTQKNPSLSLNSIPKVTKLRVVYINMNKLYQIPLVVASKKDLFKKHSLDIELFTADKQASTMLLANQADIFLGGPYNSLAAFAEGGEISWIGNVINDSPNVIISYKKLNEIKSLFYPGGTMSKAMAIDLIKRLKEDTSDITFTGAASNQAALIALTEKKIDAMGVIPKAEWLVYAKKNNIDKNEFRTVIDTGQDANLQAIGAIITRNNYLKDNKEALENFVKAILEATSWVQQNPTEAKILLGEELKIDQDETEIYTDEYILLTKNLQFSPNSTSMQYFTNLLKEDNPQKKDLIIDNFISSIIANSLKNSGFLENLGFK